MPELKLELTWDDFGNRVSVEEQAIYVHADKIDECLDWLVPSVVAKLRAAVKADSD